MTRQRIVKQKPVPLEVSKAMLIEVIKKQPGIKPKAAARILGWTERKIASVMVKSKTEFVCGLVLLTKEKL